MTPDRALTRLFAVLTIILGGMAAVASWLLQSWLPLLTVGVVLLCVTALTLSEATLFAPLLALVMRAGSGPRKPAARQPSPLATAKPTPPHETSRKR
jgi:hypothetical protein